MNGVTGEELETMGAWCDKLVLYKVFKKKGERYHFTKPFLYHMKQFVLFLEELSRTSGKR